MELFPFPTVRSGQKEFLDDAREAISTGMHLLAHAPTGVGKTSAALTAALEYGMERGMLTLFLTSRQSHHKIAIQTLRLMKKRSGRDIVVVDIIAKQSMCPREDVTHFFPGEFHEFCRIQQRTHRCRYAFNESEDLMEALRTEICDVGSLIRMATAYDVCPYKAALELGALADVIVCDYNYLFSPAEDTILSRLGRSSDELLVIVDEAHNLPDRIRDHLSLSITPFDLKDAIKEIKGLKGEISPRLSRHLRSMLQIFDAFAKRAPQGGETLISKDDLLERIGRILKERLDPLSLDEFIEMLADSGREVIKDGAYRSALSQLASFLEVWSQNDDVSVRIFENRDPPRISYRLLDPSVFSREIFAQVHGSILMSGTLFPEMTRDLLGIEEERSMLRTYQSPFPGKNRLILAVGGITTLYSKRDEVMFEKIGDRISAVAARIPGNLAVFFPSYTIMDAVLPYVRSGKRIVKEGRSMTKDEKDGIYEVLMNLKERGGGILAGVMGGSLAEGVDYPANALDGVVIVGVPLSPPSLEVKSLIEYYEKKFRRGYLYGYIYPAMNRVLQAAGRCIRSEEDRGVIVLMDDRFGMRKYLNCLPPEWRVIVSDDWEELIEEFFYA
ncbi:MAG TPA: ATP-dependent DNA helicase [Candidatus Syntrophoarchaeum butanivorans]|uniref:ATP-dependent DNA helicase n=1 Tax=Candidatus Syntropharchaeum butanivorans TaxID=1839936 RepID=A0A1F2P662_9EURY|nr:MAG: dEAD2 domain protein [Candidatus Syntrophoarchaeum butanivorans]HEC56346.1 ATP-dependent DNA helicase [Candidatus Syntrophoarchaeum butanivorans]